MISYTVKGIKTFVSEKVFKDGAVNVNINCGSQMPNFEVREVLVDANLNGSDSILALMLTMDALRRQYPRSQFGLVMPYTMYARQDRACNDGEAVGISVFGKLIDSLGFQSVMVCDPHSIATQVAIDNCHAVSQYEIFKDIKSSWREWIIVAPDAGATKKCEDFAKLVGAEGVLTFHKQRNPETMEIEGVYASDNIYGSKSYMVLDDICDGGRTFVEIFKAIGIGKRIELAVTHGIFSYGVDVVTNVYDHVYTTNSFRQDLVSDSKLTVIEL